MAIKHRRSETLVMSSLTALETYTLVNGPRRFGPVAFGTFTWGSEVSADEDVFVHAMPETLDERHPTGVRGVPTMAR